jgi:hypothetical protein
MTFENVAVPFIAIGNRQVLTDQQATEMPWVADFIRGWPNCFERIESLSLWVWWPEGDAPCTSRSTP